MNHFHLFTRRHLNFHRPNHRCLHHSPSLSSSISVNRALRLLQLHHNPNYTPNELRDAYFKSAKLCHPDSSSASNKGGDDACTMQFLEITEAYELLGRRKNSTNTSTEGTRTNKNDGNGSGSSYDDSYNDEFIIRRSEEEQFRTACREYLGLDAETVEESKRCPLFREWLKGKTDAAFHWNNFFMLNGGLAPMLNREKTHRISQGDVDRDGYGYASSNKKRRRRKGSERKR